MFITNNCNLAIGYIFEYNDWQCAVYLEVSVHWTTFQTGQILADKFWIRLRPLQEQRKLESPVV